MGVAETLVPLVAAIAPNGLPLAIRCWDGSTVGPASPTATIEVRSPDALRRLLWAPNELGFGRAYVAGDLDIDGDLFEALTVHDQLSSGRGGAKLELGIRGWLRALRSARRLGVLGLPLKPPAEEARLKGGRHSHARDAAAIAYHYDISNDFYRLVLGPTMTYSCAYFEQPDYGLDEAQIAKYDLICRKLGLEAGMRLLDVGCGWGGMVLHAATHYGVDAVGVTVSRRQADLAGKRIAEHGLGDRVEVRLQDYRDIDDAPYDAISSIGMFEHVGLARLAEYFGRLSELLRPEGRLLNHGISRLTGRARFSRHSFIDRYVFPDGELHEVGTVVSAMQAQRLEVRDVESLREHYALTLRAWVANLEANWHEAQELVGPARARIWRLYMAACALNFERGACNLHHVLGVKLSGSGASGMPASRTAWLAGDDLATTGP
jgi:cyclopropane-fatty-acyl-phospholipid synthase